MAGMINCMRFRPKTGQAEALFKAYAEYVRDYPFDDIMHKIIDLGDNEFALIGVHHSVDSFIIGSALFGAYDYSERINLFRSKLCQNLDSN